MERENTIRFIVPDKLHSSGIWLRTFPFLTLAIVFLFSSLLASPKEKANGTLTYKDKTKSFTSSLKHAYLVKGPHDYEKDKTIRRIIFSPTDIAVGLQSAKSMSEAVAALKEGMTIDFDAGPRLNYWITLNGGLVQYSGTATLDTFTKTTESGERITGKLMIDDADAGGPKVEVEFDAPLLKTYKTAR